jgi:hypothetical protein
MMFYLKLFLNSWMLCKFTLLPFLPSYQQSTLISTSKATAWNYFNWKKILVKLSKILFFHSILIFLLTFVVNFCLFYWHCYYYHPVSIWLKYVTATSLVWNVFNKNIKALDMKGTSQSYRKCNINAMTNCSLIRNFLKIWKHIMKEIKANIRSRSRSSYLNYYDAVEIWLSLHLLPPRKKVLTLGSFGRLSFLLVDDDDHRNFPFRNWKSVIE